MFATLTNLIITFSMRLMGMLDHLLVLTVSKVKLVLLVRRCRVERSYRVRMLHVSVHSVSILASHVWAV